MVIIITIALEIILLFKKEGCNSLHYILIWLE